MKNVRQAHVIEFIRQNYKNKDIYVGGSKAYKVVMYPRMYSRWWIRAKKLCIAVNSKDPKSNTTMNIKFKFVDKIMIKDGNDYIVKYIRGKSGWWKGV